MQAPEPCRATHASAPREAPSLIETMRVEAGAAVPLLDLHLERLRRSSHDLGYPCPGDATVRGAIHEQVASLPSHADSRLRMLLGPAGHLSFEASPLPSLALPLQVALGGCRQPGADEWLGHKSTHRPWYESAARWLAEHPAIFDLLYWNEAGEMAEGSRSNLYMQTPDGSWVTPPLSAGALPGVQRSALLRAGRVHEAPIHRDAFLQARAWRISNALRGWCDVDLIQETID